MAFVPDCLHNCRVQVVNLGEHVRQEYVRLTQHDCDRGLPKLSVEAGIAHQCETECMKEARAVSVGGVNFESLLLNN